MSKLTPMRAIRAKCLECSCRNVAEVRRCPVSSCALYAYRMGHRPKGDTDTTPGTISPDAPQNPATHAPEGKEKSPLV